MFSKRLSKRFNRYIVECKVKIFNYTLSIIADLIDTLWNVKSLSTYRSMIVLADLIDTLWNVKWHMDESRKHLLIKR